MASRLERVPVSFSLRLRLTGELVVAEEHGRAVVRRDEEVDVAVTVEVATRQAASDTRHDEVGPGRGGEVLEAATARVHEQEGRLGVPDAAAS